MTASLNLIELKFFKAYPFMKQHILYYSYVLAFLHRVRFTKYHCVALPMSPLAVRFRTQLGKRFSEEYYVYLLSILGHCFDVVSLGKAFHPQMLHLTPVKMRRGLPGRTEMAMCEISSMRRNGCGAVCSPWS